MSQRKIGIEIENESLAISHGDVARALRASTSWVVERDGSLRGHEMGWEVKTSGRGLPLDQALLSLNELYPVLRDCSGVWRAAIHVHVDATNLSWEQRALVLCMAYILDDSMFDLVSPERRESNFCVPLAQKAGQVLESIVSMVDGGEGTIDYGKYSSVNAGSLLRFGTFEFRHMRTPATDDTISSVTNALYKIAAFAQASHAIVDSARQLAIVNRSYPDLTGSQRVLKAVLMLSDAEGALYNPVGLHINDEAALDIIQLLDRADNPNVSIVDLDLGSFVLCVPQEERSRRSRMREQLGERLEQVRLRMRGSELDWSQISEAPSPF